MSKVSTADFRNGMVLNLDGVLYAITEFQHVKPGKGPAFVRTKLKGIVNEKNIDKTWRSGEKTEAVRVCPPGTTDLTLWVVEKNCSISLTRPA